MFVAVKHADEDEYTVIDGDVEGDGETDCDGDFDMTAESVRDDDEHPDDDGYTVNDVVCVIARDTVALEQSDEELDGETVSVTDGECEPDGDPENEPVIKALLESMRVTVFETVPVSLFTIDPVPDGVTLPQTVAVCVAHWDVV